MNQWYQQQQQSQFLMALQQSMANFGASNVRPQSLFADLSSRFPGPQQPVASQSSAASGLYSQPAQGPQHQGGFPLFSGLNGLTQGFQLPYQFLNQNANPFAFMQSSAAPNSTSTPAAPNYRPPSASAKPSKKEQKE